MGEIFSPPRPERGRSGGQLSQPLDHFLAFLTAPDFHCPAILFALALGAGEHIHELFELTQIHHIALTIGGDICELVGVDTLGIQIPDPVKGIPAFAQATGHKGEAGSLDADSDSPGVYVAVTVICGAVVLGAGDTVLGAERPFGGVRQLGGGGHVNSKLFHFFDLLFFPFCDFIIHPSGRVVKTFFHFFQTFFGTWSGSLSTPL